MKIIELCMKNLNSLYGDWYINFQDSEYLSSGIFALTGPTGAGKSTILDAITLALYGRTPRLSTISSTTNEIISRGAGECYAEVVFESQERLYRILWRQHRSRKRADGQLQQPEHILSEYESGDIVEDRKSAILDAVKAKTGMDFSQFTRSVLLAQGGFDAFLKADMKSKSEMLSEITGTEIYADLSVMAYERYRSEEQKLSLLKDQISGINPLSTEAYLQLEVESRALQKEFALLEREEKHLSESLKWYNEIDKLRGEIRASQESLRSIEREEELFKPKLDLLTGAERALKLKPLSDELEDLASSILKREEESKKLSTKLLESEKRSQKLETDLKDQEVRVEEVRSRREKQLPLLRDARSYERELVSRREQYHERNNLLLKHSSDKKEIESLLIKCENDLKLEEERALNARDYCSKNSGDTTLPSKLDLIKDRFDRLQKKTSSIEDMKALLKRADGEFKALSLKHESDFRKLEEVRIELHNSEANLKRRELERSDNLQGGEINSYRRERDLLFRQKALYDQIASYEEARKKLVDGQPCALCGSLHHPYAEGNKPEADFTDREISRIEAIIIAYESADEECSKLKKGVDEIREVERERSLKLSELTIKMDSLNEQKKEREALLADEKAEFEKSKDELIELIKPYGLETIDSSALHILAKRAEDWTRFNEIVESSKKAQEGIVHKLDLLRERLADKSVVVAELQKEVENLGQEGRSLREKLSRIVGTRSAEERESELEKEFTDNLNRSDQLKNAVNEAKQKLSLERSSLEHLSKDISELSTKRDLRLAQLQSGLVEQSFETIDDFKSYLLTEDELNSLKRSFEELKSSKSRALATLEDREERLKREVERSISEDSYEVVLERERVLKESIDKNRESQLECRGKLLEADRLKEEFGKISAQIEAQKVEFDGWSKLNELIGSARGDKFRKFAQSITFEFLVSLSNEELKRMSDRYLLSPVDDSPMELNVVDLYQAGEERSVKNLSGGETFIVSLALALGLSKMASQNVRVDSLFLDEGFGTLDEDALETALRALSTLNDEGKIIGVISHVEALKEQISAQIEVRPISGGRSLLRGPGVEKLD